MLKELYEKQKIALENYDTFELLKINKQIFNIRQAQLRQREKEQEQEQDDRISKKIERICEHDYSL